MYYKAYSAQNSSILFSELNTGKINRCKVTLQIEIPNVNKDKFPAP